MKKILPLISLLFSVTVKAQKPVTVGDFTVHYIISGDESNKQANLNGVSKILYVKGKMARADFISNDYKQTVVYNDKTGNAVILKEFGGGKFMTNLSADQWKKENKRYDGMSISFTEEKKVIAGYECKKAVITLKNGMSYTLYYAGSILPSTTENPFQFKDIPGLVLEFETFSDINSSKVKYTASIVDLSPVPASRFDLPTSGFRVLQ